MRAQLLSVSCMSWCAAGTGNPSRRVHGALPSGPAQLGVRWWCSMSLQCVLPALLRVARLAPFAKRTFSVHSCRYWASEILCALCAYMMSNDGAAIPKRCIFPRHLGAAITSPYAVRDIQEHPQHLLGAAAAAASRPARQPAVLPGARCAQPAQVAATRLAAADEPVTDLPTCLPVG
jgi:hypothetical protein